MSVEVRLCTVSVVIQYDCECGGVTECGDTAVYPGAFFS